MSDPDTSVSSVTVENDNEAFDGPPWKKSKKSIDSDTPNNLEHRLEGILCCVVCLDLPYSSVYQCSNGHLMCAGCFTHLLADSRLRDENAKCPTCRIEFSKQSASRNLAVEKALSELPSSCRFCCENYPRNLLTNHEDTQCKNRLTACKFQKIGCIWRGPFHESWYHESACVHPNRSGAEVMETLKIMQDKQEQERKLLSHIFDLMSFEKIIFNDLQMRPYRTDEYVHKLFYETSRFSAGLNQWIVKARISDGNNKTDPCELTDRKMVYQLSLKNIGKTTYPIVAHFLILPGPFGDMKVAPKIYKFDYTETENDSPFLELPLQDTSECNRLLSSKVINFSVHLSKHNIYAISESPLSLCRLLIGFFFMFLHHGIEKFREKLAKTEL